MPQTPQDRATNQAHFESGDTPTEGQFETLIFSFANLINDKNILGLRLYDSAEGAEKDFVVVDPVSKQLFLATQKAQPGTPLSDPLFELLDFSLNIVEAPSINDLTTLKALDAASAPFVFLDVASTPREGIIYVYNPSALTFNEPFIVSASDGGTWVAVAGSRVSNLIAEDLTVNNTANIDTLAVSSSANITSATIDDLRVNNSATIEGLDWTDVLLKNGTKIQTRFVTVSTPEDIAPEDSVIRVGDTVGPGKLLTYQAGALPANSGAGKLLWIDNQGNSNDLTLDLENFAALVTTFVVPARMQNLFYLNSGHTGWIAFYNLDPWHIVGASGEPGFKNDFQNATGTSSFGPLQEPLQFRKLNNRRVQIKGFIEQTDIPANIPKTVFTLPALYRPQLARAMTSNLYKISSSGFFQSLSDLVFVTDSGQFIVLDSDAEFGMSIDIEYSLS